MGRSFAVNDNPLARLIEDWVRAQPAQRLTTFVKRLAPKIQALRGRKIELAHLEREVRKWRARGSVPLEFRGPVAEVLGVDQDVVDEACGENSRATLDTPPSLQRLRYVATPVRLLRDSTTGVVAADISLVLHNPNDFDLRFSATMTGKINGVGGEEDTISIEGYSEANSDLTLDYDRIWDIPTAHTSGVSAPCLAGTLEYEIVYRSAFSSSIEGKKGARLRLIVWKWPFKERQDCEFDIVVRFGNEIEELMEESSPALSN